MDKNKVTKVIKQRDRLSCVACVACMATGTKLSEFRKFFGDKKPPYSDLDCAKYLIEHGYWMGIGFNNSHGTLSPDDVIQINLPLRVLPAYVVVKSHRFPGMPHSVYWDGEKIFDSNPLVEGDGLPLEDYEVIYWMPIYKVGYGVFELDLARLMQKSK